MVLAYGVINITCCQDFVKGFFLGCHFSAIFTACDTVYSEGFHISFGAVHPKELFRR